MTLTLSDRDQSLASGEQGPAAAMAMRMITRLAEANRASRLIDVGSAHIDSCLYHGEAGLDFAERLVISEAQRQRGREILAAAGVVL